LRHGSVCSGYEKAAKMAKRIRAMIISTLSSG
jgi:hypothetical protein